MQQHFPVVLFIMLYKMVLTFESVDEILKCVLQVKSTELYFAFYYAVQGGTNLMKSTEQYFPVVLFIMLHKVVQTFESVDEILKCVLQVKSTELYFAFYYAVQGGTNFVSNDEMRAC